jgi:hypothetical protein
MELPLPANVYDMDFDGGDYRQEEEEFLRAMALYQKRSGRRYPSWCEVLYVAKCLGYRKVAAAVEPQSHRQGPQRRRAQPQIRADDPQVEALAAALRRRWIVEVVQLVGTETAVGARLECATASHSRSQQQGRG